MFKTILSTLLIIAFSLGGTFATSPLAPTSSSILTTEWSAVITPPEDNAIRQGAHDIIKSKESGEEVSNLLETQNKIEDQKDATQRTINLIHKIINYALSLVSFVALIILIFAGIQMVTAGGDDGKFKAGQKAIKKITIGIIGIGISWLIVSFIFRLLRTLT